MNDIQTMYREAFHKRVKELIKGYFESSKAIPDELPTPRYARIDIIEGHPTLEYPYDRKLVKQIETIMVALGWNWSDYITESEVEDGWMSVAYRANHGKTYEGPQIVFRFNDNFEGSTCKRVKIADREPMKREVYEFVCKEA